MEQNKPQTNNTDPENDQSKKRSRQKAIIISVSFFLIVIIAVSLYIFLYIPYRDATVQFNNSVNEFNIEVSALEKRNNELDQSIESLSQLFNRDNIPIDESLFAEPRSILNTARELQKDTAPALPQKPKHLADIESEILNIAEMTSEVRTLGNYSTTLKTLSDTEVKYKTIIDGFKPAELNLLWFNVENEFNLLRFAVQIKNPNPYFLTGVKTEWTAYDKDNVIVGFHEGIQPVVPANGCIYYVGGAGSANLSGIPARVEVKIVSDGLLTNKLIPQISVNNIQIKDHGYNYYEVFADCITDSNINTADLSGTFILKDGNGQIIGAEFWSADNLPQSIIAGGKFKISIPFFDLPTIPHSADVNVYHVHH